MACAFYRTEMVVQRSNAHYPGAKEFAPKRIATPYCAHASSINRKGSGKALTCGGDLAQCAIKDKV